MNVYPAPHNTPPVLTNTGRWLYSSAPAAIQNALGYRWFRNDTLISGATSSSYSAAAAGTYKVKYYYQCGEGPASNSISIAAASVPQTISFPAIPNKTYGDPDFIIPVTASSGLPVSFSITSGPGSIPGNTYHITTTGTATVALRLMDHAQCPDLRLTLVKGADHRFSTPEWLALIRASVDELTVLSR